jgi:hypothetical protein
MSWPDSECFGPAKPEGLRLPNNVLFRLNRFLLQNFAHYSR